MQRHRGRPQSPAHGIGAALRALGIVIAAVPGRTARWAHGSPTGGIKRPRGWGDGWTDDRRLASDEREAALRAVDTWIEACRAGRRALQASHAELRRLRRTLRRQGDLTAFQSILSSGSSRESAESAYRVLDAQLDARRLQSELASERVAPAARPLTAHSG